MMGWGQSGQWVRARSQEGAELFAEEQRRVAPRRPQRTRRQRRLFVIGIGLLGAVAFLGPLALRLLG